MSQFITSTENPSIAEIAELAATDHRLYNKTFFPKTFRNGFPDYVDDMWDVLESDKCEFVNLQLFRGSSKTTNSRAYMSKRIAYGVSRTILCICASAAKAYMSVGWIAKAVIDNHTWANVFGLRVGDKWTEDLIEIKHTIFGHSVWVIAFGLTGSHRGINIDDYRPDLIMIDDIIDEENSASVEQRRKAEDLVLGSLVDSLAPTTENPQAKMIVAQTPFHKEDFSMKACKDPMWTSITQGCWTKETENLPLEMRKSVWEERFPSEKLRARKVGAIARNKASLFAREMECRIVSKETSEFKAEWLKKIRSVDEIEGGLKGMYIVIAIDPVPPPNPQTVEKRLHKNDFECLAVVGYKKNCYYVLELSKNRGHDPNWTVGEFFRLAYKWRPKKLIVEQVAYQRTLAWLISQAMIRQRYFVPIEPQRGTRRSKRDRITDSLAGIGAHGYLYCMADMADFITNFEDYSDVTNDDDLDAVSLAIDGMLTIELSEDEWEEVDDMPPLNYIGGCP